MRESGVGYVCGCVFLRLKPDEGWTPDTPGVVCCSQTGAKSTYCDLFAWDIP